LPLRSISCFIHAPASIIFARCSGLVSKKQRPAAEASAPSRREAGSNGSAGKPSQSQQTAQQQQSQQQIKPNGEPSRAKCEAGTHVKRSSKAPAGAAAAKPKREVIAGTDTSKVSRSKVPTKGGAASKPAATDRPPKKEAAAGGGSKDAAEGGQAVKKEAPAAEQPLKKDPAAPERSLKKEVAAADRPLKKEAAAPERLLKKEAAAPERPLKKEAATAARSLKGAAAAERPLKKEATAVSKKEAVGQRPGKRVASAADQVAKELSASDQPAKKEAAVVSTKATADTLIKPSAETRAKIRRWVDKAIERAFVGLKPEQQQEHAGSNPSSMQLEGGDARQQQQISSPPRPAASKAEPGNEGGSTSTGTPVELLAAPDGPASHVGELAVALYSGHGELWEALQSRFGGALPPVWRAPPALACSALPAALCPAC
jgi:hypothetical protein